MHAINLYILSKVSEPTIFSKFEKQLSQRQGALVSKQHEIDSISTFVDEILSISPNLALLDNFYYSFIIPQIGKEFDLLRINNEKIINIELKSTAIEEEKIHKQLSQNIHYLSFLTRPVHTYCFIADSKTVYTLNEKNNLITVPIDHIIEQLKSQENCFENDIAPLFRVSDFLISPLNTPEKFLEKQYFLTSQQETFKKDYIKIVQSNNHFKFLGITGAAGTGKTLLLYDFALESAQTGRCCMIHCGSLSDGHLYLNATLNNVDIVSIKSITENFDFSMYDYLFIDESHRIFRNQFDFIVKKTKELGLVTTFSFDSNQVLSSREAQRQIATSISELPSIYLMQLSDKIRSNKEMASFIKKLMDQKKHDTYQAYPSVSLSYATNTQEAINLVKHFKEKNYTFINYSTSLHVRSPYDKFTSLASADTHHVIGQEFDNVVMLMDDSFFYNENKVLCTRTHPNPDYLYKQLLFQGLTRVREKLAIIVVEDFQLFQNILNIL